jgi:4-hydroxythreonine-4-phosphate dehydrogenase
MTALFQKTSGKRPAIALTLGDPNGIGPEIVRKTLRDSRLPRGFRFEVLGSARGIKPGKCTRRSAKIALDALREAAQGCLDGKYAGMVTGPVNKEAIDAIAPGFVGQTEFLAHACGKPDADAVMTLTDPRLTVALCTTHCSLRDALKRLTSARIVYVTRTVHAFLRASGIAKPRLAIAAINPHAGENGLFGDEEKRLIAPAVRALAREKIAVTVAPADTLFYRAAREKAFDAVICAYHDQGLIPFKLLAFDTGVNLTLGLPIIRTSPDHGTALELAGRGVARHESMLAAVRLACRLARAQKTAKQAL